MKSSLQKNLCVLTILAGVALFSGAQTNIPTFQFGINAGVFIYQGDLTPSTLGSYRTLRPTISLFAAKFLSASFAVRGNLALGSLRGNDAAYSQPEYRHYRAFNFHSPVAELSGLGEWNILGRNYKNRGLAPYVFGGAGISFLRIRRDFSAYDATYFGEGSAITAGLNADLQHRTPRLILVLPVGAGIRYYLSDKIGVSAETIYRIMSNDYLDGFSQATNPAKGDHYQSHTIGLTYRLGKKNTLDCPVIKY